MPRFPSLEWCQALVTVAEKEPGIAEAAREWGGKSVGFIVGKDKGLTKDFCIYAKPHPTEVRLEILKVCEDEDDLELEEPDYIFRAPLSLCRQLFARQLDPIDVLLKGQVRVDGDLKKLVPFSQKHRLVGDRVVEKVETTF